MAVVVVPSVEDFLLRFPEFKGMDEQKISLSLYDASTYVSEDWIEVHVTQALMALAAHFLWLEQTRADELVDAINYTSGNSGDTKTVTQTGPVTMKSVGPLTVKYQGGSETTSTGSSGGGGDTSGLGVELESSIYGQRFLLLVRYSFPPVLVVI